MKKSIVFALLSLALMGLSACKRNYEEFKFKGKVVGAEMCSSRIIGYIIDFEKPEGYGDTITINGTRYQNAIMGYQATRRLKDGETIYGVAYAYKDFAALNCLIVYNNNLPEVSLISVDEDENIFDEKTLR